MLCEDTHRSLGILHEIVVVLVEFEQSIWRRSHVMHPVSDQTLPLSLYKCHADRILLKYDVHILNLM